MMMGSSHRRIPFVGTSGENFGPDVDLEKKYKFKLIYAHYLGGCSRQLFCKRDI